MRLANVAGRATLIGDQGAGIDVEKASDGAFPSDPQRLYEQWQTFREWAAGREDQADVEIADEDLRAPTPRPQQVFAIGLNYGGHAAESGFERPASPPVFTKFPSSITGPNALVALPCATVDWEVELVVAIGTAAHRVQESRAWSHVAGLMVGQDLSERTLQLAGAAPQFSLGKSYPGFAPLGPSLVTPDELDNVDDLELGCELDGEVLQVGRTRDLIFTVPELIARLSAVCPLSPGDIIFTGTPAGVGAARTPPRFLHPGTTLTSHVEGVGALRTTFTTSDLTP